MSMKAWSEICPLDNGSRERVVSKVPGLRARAGAGRAPPISERRDRDGLLEADIRRRGTDFQHNRPGFHYPAVGVRIPVRERTPREGERDNAGLAGLKGHPAKAPQV